MRAVRAHLGKFHKRVGALTVPENHLRGASRAVNPVMGVGPESVREMLEVRHVLAAGDTLALFPLGGPGPLALRAAEMCDVMMRA
jgi:hypothetical protein